MMEYQNGKNLKYLRTNNKKAIIKILTIDGPCSRVDIAKRLGLSKMTISNIVTELIQQGYLLETKRNDKIVMPTTGPKPMMISLERNKILSIGIYISREGVFGALIDVVAGEIYRERAVIKRNETEESLIKKIYYLIDNILLNNHQLKLSIIGIGVASIGLVNREEGVISKIADCFKISNVKIKSILQDRYTLPVFISNDMQASALAEQIYGNGRNKKNFIFLGITDSIGAAVVASGRVLSGSHGFATEAGHMSVNYQGDFCECGNRGCFELYASIPVLLKKTTSINFRELLEKIDEKDPMTIKVMDNFIRVCDIALTNLTNLFDSEFIILGYEAALFDSAILKRIEDLVNVHIIQRDQKHIKIVPSLLKELGPLRGSGSLVFKAFFYQDITKYNKYF